MKEAGIITLPSLSPIVRGGAVAMIRVYQRTLSPDHGVFSGMTSYGCKYYPSCSEYTAQSILKNGVFKGVGQGAWRIARCNPFSHGGIDEVK